MHAVNKKVKDLSMGVWLKLKSPLKNQSGLQIIEIVGWGTLAVLIIVLMWGLIAGWLPTMFAYLTDKLKNLS